MPVNLVVALDALRLELAQAAQEVIAEWEQDDEGFDEEFGTGGVCDRVSDALANVIASTLSDVEIEEGGQDGDDHSFLIISDGDVQVMVDVPPQVYETGGGYRWRKRKGAEVRPEDLVIEVLEAV